MSKSEINEPFNTLGSVIIFIGHTHGNQFKAAAFHFQSDSHD